MAPPASGLVDRSGDGSATAIAHVGCAGTLVHRSGPRPLLRLLVYAESCWRIRTASATGKAAGHGEEIDVMFPCDHDLSARGVGSA